MKTLKTRTCRVRGRRSGWFASAIEYRAIPCPGCAAYVIPDAREIVGNKAAFVLPVHPYEQSSREALEAHIADYEPYLPAKWAVEGIAEMRQELATMAA